MDEWRGNVFQGVPANFQAVQVVNTAGQTFSAKVEAKTNWGTGVRIFLENWPKVGEFFHQDLPDGDYEFTAQFIDDKLVFSGKRDGQLAFKHSVVDGALRLAEVVSVDLWTYQYGAVGTDQWMDDVSIRQFACRHPKHGSCK